MANWVLFDNFRLKQLNGNGLNLDAGGAALKIALITSTRAPVQATDTLWTGTGLSSNEVSGTNYTAGGIAVNAGQSVALSAGVVKFTTSTTIKWTQSGAGFSTARYAVLYDSTSNKLVAYFDIGSNLGNVAGDLSIAIDTNGIFTTP